MRPRVLVRFIAPAACVGGVLFGCAQIAGLDDESSSSSGQSSGTMPSAEGGMLADGIQVEPAELALETTDCGRESKAGAVLVLNKGKNDLSYALKSPDKMFVVRGKATGIITPGGSERLEIVATPTLAQEQKSALILTLNGVDNVYNAKVTGQGATFELSQTAVDFGDVRKQIGAKTSLTVRNLGGRPLSAVMEGAGGDVGEFVITPTTVNAPSDGSASFEVALKSGNSTTASVSAKFKPKAAGVCGTIPELEVRGRRITTDVTIDTVDWGDVGCKAQPAERNAIIKNYGTAPVTYSAALSGGAGSAFQITGGAAATVNGGSETNPAQQTVKLKVLPSTSPGQRDETLTITYPGGPSTGKVRSYFFGLVLGINPAAFTFSSDGGTEQKRTFNLVNSGPYGSAVAIPVEYKTTGAGFRTQNGSNPYFPILGNGGAVDVIFKATQGGTVNGKLTIDGTVCSQTDVNLTGNNP